MKYQLTDFFGKSHCADMIIKPVDEMSLRHLFSSSYAFEILRMSYLGPVLGPAGQIETSPDCLIIDQRKDPYRIRRCEFKLSPVNAGEFAHNGLFDIAVIWSVKSDEMLARLKNDLYLQNKCTEIVVLSRFKAFSDLPSLDSTLLNAMDRDFERIAYSELAAVILGRELLDRIYAAYIAASLPDRKISLDSMVALLGERFETVRKMKSQGRGNVVGAWYNGDIRPKLLEPLAGRWFRWSPQINARYALNVMDELLRTKFLASAPTREDIERIKQQSEPIAFG